VGRADYSGGSAGRRKVAENRNPSVTASLVQGNEWYPSIPKDWEDKKEGNWERKRNPSSPVVLQACREENQQPILSDHRMQVSSSRDGNCKQNPSPKKMTRKNR